MDEIGTRLERARKHAGFETARDAARSLGVNVQTYAGHENGHGGIKVDSAVQYAKKFRVRLEWLLTGKGDMLREGVVPLEIEQNGLPVIGSIQAGIWLDTTLLDQEADESLPLARDERFPHARQYALRVLGDSMSDLYPEGCYVTCVDFAESGLQMREGLVVHVERQINGGQLIEITLKIVERRAGELVLAPRSPNPKWTAYPLKALSEGEELVIRGVVTGKYERTVI
jgi:SOS-response transcriptional repressor LexA